MLGLCHVCFTSAVPIFITKGLVHCENCKDVKPQEEKKIEEKILAFEDLPQADPETRSLAIYKMVADLYDAKFIEKMAQDRLLDKD